MKYKVKNIKNKYQNFRNLSELLDFMEFENIKDYWFYSVSVVGVVKQIYINSFDDLKKIEKANF
jgi:hypothetical protein